MQASGFFAYPVVSTIVTDAILGAVELSKSDDVQLKPWQKLTIVGFKIDDLIREQIHDVQFLVADITYPNYNVLYEIGYAIAVGKPVILTVNVAIAKAVKRIQQIGLFDTIGWATYSNAGEILEKLHTWKDISWTGKYLRRKDHGQPLFILDVLKKTDFRNHIFHAVENSHVKYRSFDPEEMPRLTAAQAISEVSTSAGVIVPIIDNELVDFENHNLRGAFILGLSHGFGLEPLAIQYGNAPAPLDYRDYITNSTFRRETESHVEKYCADTLVFGTRKRPHVKGGPTSACLVKLILVRQRQKTKFRN
jgi:hypothetical protein